MLGLVATPAVAQDRIAAEVREALAAYVLAINEGRGEDVARMYVEGPATGSVGDGLIYRGWPAVEQVIASIVKDPGSVELRIDNVTVAPLGADAAVAYFDTEWRTAHRLRPAPRGL